MSIRIRTAEHEDVPALVESATGLFQDDAGVHDSTMNASWPQTEEGAPYYAAAVADSAALCLLAEDDGEVVGHLVGRFQASSLIRPVHTGVLESVRVAPSRRGTGVGSALIKSFVDWSASCGATRATVTAFAANEGARRFYERHGFQVRSVLLDRSI